MMNKQGFINYYLANKEAKSALVDDLPTELGEYWDQKNHLFKSYEHATSKFYHWLMR